jgi:hypothetical protein
MDSIIFFTLTGKDLTVERTGSYVKVTGSSYEPDELRELIEDATVTSFDFRGYTRTLPNDIRVGNPNAILYVNVNQKVLKTNMVVDGICNNLSLQYGHDYDPIEGFTALKATCRIMCTPCPGTTYYWNSLSLPFSVKTPDGMLARKFIDESHTDISNGGTLTITGSGKYTTDANYLIYNTGTLTITAKALTITAKNQSISFGDSIATGTGQVTVSGLISGDSLTGISLAASTTAVTTSGTITPSSATTTNGANNYSITYNTGSLTIGKRAITITAKA